MSKENWEKGYKEVKNLVHNEIGLEKEEIINIFKKIAKEEVQKIVKEERNFIKDSLREVIKEEMMEATRFNHYPTVTGNMWGYDRKKEHNFSDFIIDIMKNEVIENLRGQFDVNIEFNKKD